MTSNIQAAKVLGWASLAIGATELAATDWLEDQMGVDDHRGLIRAFGLREIAAGVTLLAQPGLNKTLAGGMWARVAGDALDLVALAAAAPTTRRPMGLAAVAAMVVGVTVADVFVGLGVQGDLARATARSAAARQRVTPTSATPTGAVPVEDGAAGRFAGTRM
jgi:hypothetical protein